MRSRHIAVVALSLVFLFALAAVAYPVANDGVETGLTGTADADNGASSPASGRFHDIAGAYVKTSVAQVASKIKQAWADSRNSLAAWFSGFKNSLGSSWQSAKAKISRAFTAAKDFLASIWTWFKPNAPDSEPLTADDGPRSINADGSELGMYASIVHQLSQLPRGTLPEMDDKDISLPLKTVIAVMYTGFSRPVVGRQLRMAAAQMQARSAEPGSTHFESKIMSEYRDMLQTLLVLYARLDDDKSLGATLMSLAETLPPVKLSTDFHIRVEPAATDTGASGSRQITVESATKSNGQDIADGLDSFIRNPPFAKDEVRLLDTRWQRIVANSHLGGNELVPFKSDLLLHWKVAPFLMLEDVVALLTKLANSKAVEDIVDIVAQNAAKYAREHIPWWKLGWFVGWYRQVVIKRAVHDLKRILMELPTFIHSNKDDIATILDKWGQGTLSANDETVEVVALKLLDRFKIPRKFTLFALFLQSNAREHVIDKKEIFRDLVAASGVAPIMKILSKEMLVVQSTAEERIDLLEAVPTTRRREVTKKESLFVTVASTIQVARGSNGFRLLFDENVQGLAGSESQESSQFDKGESFVKGISYQPRVSTDSISDARDVESASRDDTRVVIARVLESTLVKSLADVVTGIKDLYVKMVNDEQFPYLSEEGLAKSWTDTLSKEQDNMDHDDDATRLLQLSGSMSTSLAQAAVYGLSSDRWVLSQSGSLETRGSQGDGTSSSIPSLGRGGSGYQIASGSSSNVDSTRGALSPRLQ
ncbi:hypothetical protein SeLEV6574_g01450 [Synchytrium endobioticum]|uniref:Uncharacterized protein n=1 Tax=Synchytrium endobioticum TaxID=286115 RepID=A0A507DDF2_9FUNG|nr:hypothetical protein SeLEV6574_g01450 [Synchytrium endobioticum]